ncbi:MAG: polymer-forming cytoskeletal protein [Gemmatimonadota bacterium]
MNASCRRSVHRAVPAMASIVLLVAACQPAAFEAVDQAVHVRRGGDVIAVGQMVVVNDSVPGDVMAAAGDIRFDGTAGGDLLGAAANLNLAGRLAGSLRVAGGNVRVATDVGRNVTAAGGQVILEPAGHVRGNGYLTGGTIQLDGTVDHLVRAAGRDVVLNGLVGGDVHVESEHLRVGPDAVINGDLRYRLARGGTADIDPGSRVTGRIIALPPETGGWAGGVVRFLLMLGFLVAGLATVVVLPGAAATAEVRLRTRPGAAFGLGLAWLVLVPIAIVMVCITVIGVPLGLVAAALYLISVYLARAVVAVWIGRLILRRGSEHDRTGLALAFLTGGIVLLVLGLIPWVGKIITILTCIFGLGAMALTMARGSASDRMAEEAIEF